MTKRPSLLRLGVVLFSLHHGGSFFKVDVYNCRILERPAPNWRFWTQTFLTLHSILEKRENRNHNHNHKDPNTVFSSTFTLPYSLPFFFPPFPLITFSLFILLFPLIDSCARVWSIELMW